MSLSNRNVGFWALAGGLLLLGAVLGFKTRKQTRQYAKCCRALKAARLEH